MAAAFLYESKAKIQEVETYCFSHRRLSADPCVGILQSFILCAPVAASHIVPVRAAAAQNPRGPRHGDLEEDDEQKDGNSKSKDEGMDKASQDGREHGQDEKTEGPCEYVEDESVLRALTALLKTPRWMFETLMSIIRSTNFQEDCCNKQTLMRALTASISSSLILLITT